MLLILRLFIAVALLCLSGAVSSVLAGRRCDVDDLISEIKELTRTDHGHLSPKQQIQLPADAQRKIAISNTLGGEIPARSHCPITLRIEDTWTERIYGSAHDRYAMTVARLFPNSHLLPSIAYIETSTKLSRWSRKGKLLPGHEVFETTRRRMFVNNESLVIRANNDDPGDVTSSSVLYKMGAFAVRPSSNNHWPFVSVPAKATVSTETVKVSPPGAGNAGQREKKGTAKKKKISRKTQREIVQVTNTTHRWSTSKGVFELSTKFRPFVQSDAKVSKGLPSVLDELRTHRLHPGTVQSPDGTITLGSEFIRFGITTATYTPNDGTAARVRFAHHLSLRNRVMLGLKVFGSFDSDIAEKTSARKWSGANGRLKPLFLHLERTHF